MTAPLWAASPPRLVLVDKRVRSRTIGRVKLRFFETQAIAMAIAHHGIEQRTSHTGTYNASSPELTAVDLVAHAPHVGGLDHVATVLAEFEHLRGERLAALASDRPQSIVRRLGWLLERFGHADDLGPLGALVVTDREHPTPLAPDAPARCRTRAGT